MSTLELVLFVGFAGLAAFMLWSLFSLGSSPLHPVQRLYWMLGIVILPGIGSAAWLWWIKRYYPRRKALEPGWDPADRAPSSATTTRRPRPGRVRSQGLREPKTHRTK